MHPHQFTFAIAMALAVSGTTVAAQESPLYLFKGSPDGSNPSASVVVDAATGVIYGVTANGGTNNFGTVFQLSPPSAPGGMWTESVLYSFGPAPDGQSPSSLIEDAQTGILYGTTLVGGANYDGTLFKLTPPASAGGTWSESVLYSFSFTGAGVGVPPQGNLVMDKSGALYGAAFFSNAAEYVYQLTPPSAPASSWSEALLYTPAPPGQFFCSPNIISPGLVIDSTTGDLIGSAPCVIPNADYVSANGSIFELTPPATAGGAWTPNVFLFQSAPPNPNVPSGNLVDIQGTIYGTTETGGTSNVGTVFQLLPPFYSSGGPWSLNPLYSFSGGNDGAYPGGGLVTVGGALYGMTTVGGLGGNGTIFEMASAGLGLWTESTLYSFQGGPADGANPSAALTASPTAGGAGTGTFYGTTLYGGTGNNGTVFAATLPVPSGTAPQFRAVCNQTCFDNLLKWQLRFPSPPPLWLLGPGAVSFEAVVQKVVADDRVVEFTVLAAATPLKPLATVNGRLAVTIPSVKELKPGQHWLLFSNGPVTGSSPMLNLLGLWKVPDGK
jgi:hypothetical protein